MQSTPISWSQPWSFSAWTTDWLCHAILPYAPLILLQMADTMLIRQLHILPVVILACLKTLLRMMANYSVARSC